MKTLNSILLAAFAMATGALAQTTATTDPIGFNSITCPAGSDTYISVGFNQPAVFTGSVAAVPSANQLQFSAPGWTAGQYANTHFVKVKSGAKTGVFFTITANTTDTLTVDLSANNLTGMAQGDSVQIIPYWTLGTLLPVGSSAVTQSTGTGVLQRRTQVFFPDITHPGTNLPATGSYYQTSTGWKDAFNGNASADGVKILPDVYFIIRNRAADPATTFVAQGAVDTAPIVSELSTQQTASQDNPIANNRPIAVKLKDLDLISSGAFVGSSGTGVLARRDTILAFDNAVVGVNKPAAHIYFYDTTSSNWKDSIQSNRISDDDVIAPGTGFVIRKYKSDGATKFWTQDLVNN